MYITILRREYTPCSPVDHVIALVRPLDQKRPNLKKQKEEDQVITQMKKRSVKNCKHLETKRNCYQLILAVIP